jgi:hypothetical protein
MEDNLDLTFALLGLAMFLLPVGIAWVLGKLSFDHIPPLVFRCQNCQSEFVRAAHLEFPEVCSNCGSSDWNHFQ